MLEKVSTLAEIESSNCTGSEDAFHSPFVRCTTMMGGIGR